MCFEFRKHADAIISNCTKSWEIGLSRKIRDRFVVSKLRPSNYGHSGLNFRKTRVQLTVKLHPLFPVKDSKGGAKHVQLHISTVAFEL